MRYPSAQPLGIRAPMHMRGTCTRTHTEACTLHASRCVNMCALACTHTYVRGAHTYVWVCTWAYVQIQQVTALLYHARNGRTTFSSMCNALSCTPRYTCTCMHIDVDRRVDTQQQHAHAHACACARTHACAHMCWRKVVASKSSVTQSCVGGCVGSCGSRFDISFLQDWELLEGQHEAVLPQVVLT